MKILSLIVGLIILLGIPAGFAAGSIFFGFWKMLGALVLFLFGLCISIIIIEKLAE